METWDKLPLNLMDEFAENEAYSRDAYRPIYSLHKWWARRPGSTFRMLGLACLTGDDVEKDDLLRQTSSGNFDGMYFRDHTDEFDATILDPFVGGGTTLFELNRLGADTIGYEFNPVAWWTSKKSIDNLDLDAYKEAYQQVLADVREDLDSIYTTIDPKTGQEVEILYGFQSQRVPCQTCDETVNLMPRYILGKNQATNPAFLYCPNDECTDRIIELDRDIGSLESGSEVELEDGRKKSVSADGNEICPICGIEFDPTDGNAGRGKFTCSNGHKNDTKEVMSRQGGIPQFDYFAYYYKRADGSKGFKTLDKDDYEKLEEVNRRLDKQEDELILPSAPLPNAEEVQRLYNYNYSTFRELFTPRHQLTFGQLFARAMDIEDRNVREFVITALSNSLEYNSKLVRWNTRYRSGHVFETHSYVPRIQPIEGNPINRDGNANAVENFFKKVYNAKEYCQRPFEKVKNSKTGALTEHYINGESVDESRSRGLFCKTSEKLDLEENSVDYVITDPPYYGNVQYSELSDYFHAWLHECLKDNYEQFRPQNVPKAREIVANRQSGGKGEEFFIEGLTNVFKECHRVLKDDGEMMFTYHHNENEAWSVILEALVRSGFTLTGAYPVQSELPTSGNIRNLDNAEYDIILFANKERTTEETTLNQLRQNLFFELQDMIREERERHSDLSQADLGVILRGKCMYYYSKHYPNVFSEGETVGIDRALDTVDDVIEQVLEGSANLPTGIDPITQAYAAFCKRGIEEYDELNKHLLAKNLNVSDLEAENLVKGPRPKKEPVSADERITFIESKLNGNVDGGEDLLDIDKVQYLFHLYKSDQNTVEYLKEWKSEDLEDLADFMADVTGDDRYQSVMEMGITQF